MAPSEVPLEWRGDLVFLFSRIEQIQLYSTICSKSEMNTQL